MKASAILRSCEPTRTCCTAPMSRVNANKKLRCPCVGGRLRQRPLAYAAASQAFGDELPRPQLKQQHRTVLSEVPRILRMSIPLAVTNISCYSLNCLADSFIGRLGALSLSTSTLASSFYCMGGLSIVWGGSAGMETLVGQAHGAGNRKLMWLLLARAVLVCWCVAVPLVALWTQAGGVMAALGQNPQVAERSAKYLVLLAPSLFAYAACECLQAFMVCQGIVRPATISKAITMVLGSAYYYFFIFTMNLGIEGAAAGYFCSKATNATLLAGFLAWHTRKQQREEREQQAVAEAAAAASVNDNGRVAGGYNGSSSSSTSSSSRGAVAWDPSQPPSALVAATRAAQAKQLGKARGQAGTRAKELWGHMAGAREFLREALDPQGCSEFVKFALPTVAMSMLEMWAYEINTILAGTLPNAEVAVAVQGICLSTTLWFYMFPQAIGTAACARVSNSLGAAKPERAQRNFRSALAMVVCQQAVLAGVVLAFSRPIVTFFCQDPAVVAIATSALPLVAFNMMGEGVNAVLNAVLRACGRQALGARLQLLSYWCFGIPTSWFLGCKLGLGVWGLLAGIGATGLMQACIMGCIISRFDWPHEVERVQRTLSVMAASTEAASAAAAPGDRGAPAVGSSNGNGSSSGGGGEGGGSVNGRAWEGAEGNGNGSHRGPLDGGYEHGTWGGATEEGGPAASYSYSSTVTAPAQGLHPNSVTA